MLEKLGKLLQGKKTYIVAALIAIGAGLKYLGIDVPEFVYPMLGALGLGAVRSALDKLNA
jgi:hypothetical protein